MASLIDLLIDDLNNEDTGYNKLLDLSNDKTSAIVKGDVDELQKIFLQEQKLIEELETVEQKRQEDVKEICSILRLPYEEIRVEHIVQILEKKPKEHDALEEVYLRLKRTLNQLTTVNDNNKLLLKESMDMIQFELDLAKNSVMDPQTSNYGRTAYEEQGITGANIIQPYNFIAIYFCCPGCFLGNWYITCSACCYNNPALTILFWHIANYSNLR